MLRQWLSKFIFNDVRGNTPPLLHTQSALVYVLMSSVTVC